MKHLGKLAVIQIMLIVLLEMRILPEFWEGVSVTVLIISMFYSMWKIFGKGGPCDCFKKEDED